MSKTKLEELTDKICELLDGSSLQVEIIRSSGMFNADIRVDEVLMALDKVKERLFYLGTNGFVVFERKGGMKWGYEHYEVDYIPGKPLFQQSKETINFLHKILI